MHSGPWRQFNRKHRSAGFTMIELLVVLGVILILLSLFLVAGKFVMNSAHDRSTRTALTTARGLFAEYDGETHLQRQPTYYVGGTAQTYSAINLATNFWQGSETSLNSSSVGVITLDAITQYGAGSYDTILNTNSLMAVLKVDAATSKEINSLSTNVVTGKIVAGTSFLIDGWGDPIVYVPAGGLSNVQLGNVLGIVTSTGFHPGTSYTPTALDRPFFASAGPDGDLSKGDDNIYSFEK